jgi:hypothetical protein
MTPENLEVLKGIRDAALNGLVGSAQVQDRMLRQIVDAVDTLLAALSPPTAEERLTSRQMHKGTGDPLKDIEHAIRMVDGDGVAGLLGKHLDFINRALRVAHNEIRTRRASAKAKGAALSQRQTDTCAGCGGGGRIEGDTCSECGGSGRVHVSHSPQVSPATIDSGKESPDA